MDHEHIIRQIANGVYTLSPRRKGKSFMWNLLCEVLKEDGSILKGLVYCRSCRKLLKFSSNQTSNLCRHKCCKALKEPKLLKTATASDRQEGINTCLGWIIEDCKPFSSISGPGFTKVVQYFIKIGAIYGQNVDISDLLPEPNTISSELQKTVEEKREVIRNDIYDIVKSGGVTATIDLWSDNYIKRTFLGVTLHYQKNFKLFDINLGLKSMDFQKSTGENILKKLKTLFQQFGIEDITPIKFVTDRSSNIVKALKNYTRLNCSSHLFANVIDKSFEETTELTETLQACKKIVKYLKKAKLPDMLPTSLTNLSPTRWNSNYTMLKSIADNWYNMNSALTENEETRKLLNANISTLTPLVELCQDFDIVFKKLQVCSSPSLAFVLPSIFKIKSLCEPSTKDIPAISILKENITRNIVEIWETKLSIWHKTALFLFPPAASRQGSDINIIKEFCVSQISNFENDTLLSPMVKSESPDSDTSFNSNPPSPTSTSPSMSQFLLSSSATEANLTPHQDNQFFFSNLITDSSEASAESAKDEVERYSKELIAMTSNFQLIEWWQKNTNNYPRLSKFALQIHSIPASSASAERFFSLAGNIIAEKRNSLSPKSIDSILFLNSFYKNYDYI